MSKLICGKVGEVLNINNITVKVEECDKTNICGHCYFNGHNICRGRGIVVCTSKWRPDRKSVKFIRVI